MMSMIYVVINTQIRYMMVLTRLRTRVSYIILILMRMGLRGVKKSSAKKIWQVLTLWGDQLLSPMTRPRMHSDRQSVVQIQ
jgi:hypothetical protein